MAKPTKKIKVFVFQNGKHRIYLPHAANCQSLLDTLVRLIKEFNPDKDLKHLKLNKNPTYEITVESDAKDGFVFDGHKYFYGEVYSRFGE